MNWVRAFVEPEVAPAQRVRDIRIPQEAQGKPPAISGNLHPGASRKYPKTRRQP